MREPSRILFLLCIVLFGQLLWVRRHQGLIVLQGIKVILILDDRLAVPGDGDDSGIEHNGHNPPEKPLLYKFIPATGEPVYSTTEEWIKPASTP